MKIDKLGFYMSRCGDEVEIVFINKENEYDFVAVGKEYFEGKFYTFVTYRDEDGEHGDDSRHTLIEFIRPSGVEWPTPRKTSFVTYINEVYTGVCDLTDADSIKRRMSTKYPEKPEDIPDYKPRKISKWRFYGEELLGE